MGSSGGCTGDQCISGGGQVEINDSDTSDVTVPLIGSEGDDVGYVNVPVALTPDSFAVDISFVSTQRSDDLGSVLLDLNINDAQGRSIKQLSEPIRICLSEQESRVNKDDACLGYFDTVDRRWKCEDPCLEQEGDSFCGTTGHLTSFALLLTGGKNDPCGDGDDYTLAWISLGFICAAVLIVLLSLVVVEVRYRLVRLHKSRKTRISVTMSE